MSLALDIPSGVAKVWTHEKKRGAHKGFGEEISIYL